MANCPIFHIYSGAEAVADEIKRLVAEIPQAFAQYDLKLFDRSYEKATAQTYVTQEAYSFKVTGPISRQRNPRQLIFAFDLWRPAGAESWPHAQDALLTVAYEPRASQPWELSHMVVGKDGRLTDPDALENCVSFADGRLLEWVNGPKIWHERAWLFSVPLMRINGPDAFQKEIVEPIIALLMKGAEPSDAFEGTQAVQFRA
ncbi:hypothetical protein EBE87_23085 [Pseudoroseomonas wenyumeiae]|uniref:Uncharacterized protein n=1 Tax=Teichococcus wenyumeiae TaxID=2478470 RepID=A0A3A9JIS3_9PROT|nr:hypothetical protein [Pseudoroseomonas wenyumeiae]RKK04683.1 hypothetical protein D6Z83_08225 [Pseudoroseomonas wenyumeiae]RMI17314.1 hypothetical protein EBE87_23085 [Pseudoroseomonas wenyumeiae]